MARRQRFSCWLSSRIKLVVAYDGTDFRGWAAQTGRRTVQGTLTDAVRQISGEDCEIVGASRTDSGAHAMAQVCHFEASPGIPPEKWQRVLNNILPSDLRVVRSSSAPSWFHSRFSAQDRWYRYRIISGSPVPQFMRYAHWEWRVPNLDLMMEGAKLLEGTHDYRAFTEELDPTIENTVRKLRQVKVSRAGTEVRIDIVGTAFLRGMMRRMSGALLEVGLGKRSVGEIARLLEEAGETAIHRPVVLPACGLTLMKVRYPRRKFDNRDPQHRSERFEGPDTDHE